MVHVPWGMRVLRNNVYAGFVEEKRVIELELELYKVEVCDLHELVEDRPRSSQCEHGKGF